MDTNILGFQEKYLKVGTKDGRNLWLLEDVHYLSKSGIMYTLPAGGTTDGASTPRSIWDIIPPFGSYWRSCVLHDFAYKNTLRKSDGTPANLSFNDCNNLLLECMTIDGVNKLERDTIYSGVVLGGIIAFDRDRVYMPMTGGMG